MTSAMGVMGVKTRYEQQQYGMNAVVSVALARKIEYIFDQDSPEVTRGKLHWKIATFARELNIDVTFKDATDLKELEEIAQHLNKQHEMKMIEDLKKVIEDWGNVHEMQVLVRLQSEANKTRLNGLARTVDRINVQKRRGRNSIRDCGESAIGCEAMNCQQLDDAVVKSIVNFLRAVTTTADHILSRSLQEFISGSRAGQYPGSALQ